MVSFTYIIAFQSFDTFILLRFEESQSNRYNFIIQSFNVELLYECTYKSVEC